MDRDERIRRVIRAALTMQRWPWEQGVLAQAFMELGEAELTVLMAAEAVVNAYKDGRLAMKYDRGAGTDPASNGEPVLYAARVTGETRFTEAADRMLTYLLYRAQRTREGIILHSENQGQIWIDSCFMAPPFLAVAGHPDDATKQIEGYRRTLWDEGKRLFHHQWDVDRKTFTRPAFWGVGNGWAAAGMTRVIRALPASMEEQKRTLAGYVKEVIDGCFSHQRPDGFFHDVVDDPRTFVETNLAQMLCYAVYRGAAGGWLDDSYVARADAMRERIYAKVDERGLVRDVCAAPTFDYAGTAPEGQAFFLLMEAAERDLRATPAGAREP